MMIALVIVTGAPNTRIQGLSLGIVAVLWTIKCLVWAFFAYKTCKRGLFGQTQAPLEGLQWAALLPLALDFYGLDLGYYLSGLPGASLLPAIKDLIGVGLYIFYLSVVWAAYWYASAMEGVGRAPGLLDEIKGRLRLILPALVPYLILTFLEDILSLLPWPGLHEWLAKPMAQILFMALFLFALLFFIPPMVRWLWKCRPLPAGPLRTDIEVFLRTHRVRFKEILLWPIGGTGACTAAVLGLAPAFRYILLTPCIISHLTTQEIEAVLSHEVTHVTRRHLLWYIFFLGAYSVILYRLFDPLWAWFLSHKFFLELLSKIEEAPDAVSSLIAVIPLALLILVYFRFLIGFFMRNFEREADLSVFMTQGHPWFMITALEKVAALSGDIRNRPNWHHFSIAQRVEFLQKAANNPDLIARHHKKLLISKVIFITAASLLLLVPQLMPVQQWKKNFETNLVEIYLDQISGKGQKKAQWYLILGQFFWEQKDYYKALDTYRRALKLDPDNPEVLNNIAWLLATANDPKFRKPKEALLYAQKAVGIKAESHILDTLAECFYVNGFYRRAIATEEEALKRASKNRQYYKKQLQRFRKALNARAHPTPP